MRSFLALIFCSVFSLTSYAQTLAIGSFNKIIFEETFNFNTGQFSLSTTTDNYIILDDGDLFMSRNASSDYSLFAKAPLTLKSYRVKTALKLGPSNNKSAYVGLLLNTQIDGSGTVAIEINGKNQYRVRQIQNGKPKYISGTRSENGWIRAENLKGIEEYNYLDVVVNQGSFDIYLNYIYVASYSVPDYQSGGLGYIVSGESKARVDFTFVYKQGEAVSFEEFTTTNQRLLEVEENLRKLEEENNTLATNYASSTDELAITKNKLSEAEGVSEALNMQVSTAQKQINDLNASIAESQKTIQNLNTTKKELEGIVSNQKSSISSKEQSVQNLKNKNTQLKDDLAIANAENLALNSDLTSAKNEKSKLTLNISEKSESITALKANINSKNTEISNLKTQLSVSNAEVLALNSDLTSAKNEKSKLTLNISEKSKSIATLKGSISAKNTEISTLNTKLNSANSENSSLNASIQSLDANIAALTQKNEEKQNRIATLTTEMNQLQKELGAKQKIISSLSGKNNAYADSLSDFRNTNQALANAQKELQEVKIILSESKAKVMELLEEKNVLTAQLNEQKQIAAQFAESYRLEVQKNKQLQKEITFNQSEVSVSSTTKSSTIYRVQIGTFDDEMEFDGISDVTSIPTQDGKYIYISGKFDSYSEAKVRLMQVAELGYKEAYIVKF